MPSVRRRNNRSRIARNPASVLPVPVGETSSRCSPAAIGGHASRCAGVGPSGKAPVNQSPTGPESNPSASLASMSIVCIPAVMGHPGPIGSFSRNRLSLGSKTARGRNQSMLTKGVRPGNRVTRKDRLKRSIAGNSTTPVSGSARFIPQVRLLDPEWAKLVCVPVSGIASPPMSRPRRPEIGFVLHKEARIHPTLTL